MKKLSEEERKKRNHAYSVKYRAEHREERNAKQREYHKTHKDIIRAQQKRRYDKNKNDPAFKATQVEYAKKWRKANPEKVKEITRKSTKRWIANNPRRMKVLSLKRSFNNTTKIRTEAVKNILCGDYEKYQEDVLKAILNTETFGDQHQTKIWVGGGLLYILTQKEGIDLRYALGKIPPDALLKNNGKRKYRPVLCIWRLLKKINVGETP
jgi:hypothetical protein